MIQLSDFYKMIFGSKVYKIALNAGCTCPNRDGTKGKGGCIFCSGNGSGDFIEDAVSIRTQFEEGVKLVEKKARGRSGQNKVLYLPYFQSFTSTYGNFKVLKEKYLESLENENVCGLAVATRPDCLSEDFIDLFRSLSEKYFIQLELGLQTCSEKTGKLINRCYTNEDYKNALRLIQKEIPQAHVVTHVIFGLPGETERDMLNTVDFVVENFEADLKADGRKSYFGIKITNLYVVKNTVLEKMYADGKFRCLSKDEYFELLEKALKKLPENAVIHRITGDPPKKIAVAPDWALNKRDVFNEAKMRFNLK